ncbi:MAG TPA: CaiB/BaiF CoA-transferase family protein [Nevskiaceae bacterium]|nr:CaiB/BaiF CoA-transferase family protein [Nevskiaceae bacterium]
MRTAGPLAGVRVLEIESIGPGPHACMILADLGANVLRVSRPGGKTGVPHRPALNPILDRGRTAVVTVNLKSDEGRAEVLRLAGRADVLVEGYRPGVMERLGVGPDACHAINPKLVYGRITGWGRRGPMAPTAGHDINYIALTGALHAIGPESGPVQPLNLVGDFGGGSMLLALGIVSALLEARTSGKGQVVDAAMTDGVSTLMAMTLGMKAVGRWTEPRAGNIFDGSHYYYACYRCKDGGWMAAGPIEAEFRRIFFDKLGLSAEAEALMAPERDRDPALRARLESIFLSKTRAEWEAIFAGTDACVAPVLSIDEAAAHPHNREWDTLRVIDGAIHPMPSPRFSRTVPDVPVPAAQFRESLKADWGL